MHHTNLKISTTVMVLLLLKKNKKQPIISEDESHVSGYVCGGIHTYPGPGFEHALGKTIYRCI